MTLFRHEIRLYHNIAELCLPFRFGFCTSILISPPCRIGIRNAFSASASSKEQIIKSFDDKTGGLFPALKFLRELLLRKYNVMQNASMSPPFRPDVIGYPLGI